MISVRATKLGCLQRNIVLKAEHILGIQDDILDSMSRLKMASYGNWPQMQELDNF